MRRTGLRTGAILLAAGLLGAGCGHRVKPTAPFRDPSSIPQPSDVTASQSPGAVVLSWSAGANPYELVDGWNVYRKSQMGGVPFRLNGTLVTDVFFRDTIVVEGGSYFYSLRAVSPAGIEGMPTHDIEFRYDSVPPGTPSGLGATPEPNAIRLVWQPVGAPDLAFYRVYRDGALLATQIAQAEYLDMPVASDRSHAYEVTALDQRGNESPRSSPVVATSLPAADVTPPSAPGGLAASSQSGGIQLGWSAVADADLSGYFVYRRLDGEMAFVRVPGTSLLGTTSFLDGQVANGKTYAYVVTAVDTAGNESARSAEATATWLAPVVDTGGNTLGSVYPWCGIAANSGRMQFLVPAGDLARGGTIAKIGLAIRSGAAVYHNVTVKLAHTQAAALQSDFAANRASAGPQSTVYGPLSVDTEAQRVGSLLPLPLSAPFSYDGQSHLLVEVSWNGDDGRTAVFGFGFTGGPRLRLWQQPDGGGGAQGWEQNQQFLRFTFSS